MESVALFLFLFFWWNLLEFVKMLQQSNRVAYVVEKQISKTEQQCNRLVYVMEKSIVDLKDLS